MADLGEGVMDAAMVEAAAYCLGPADAPVVIRLLCEQDKSASMRDNIKRIASGELADNTFFPDIEAISLLDGKPYAYWVNSNVLRNLAKISPFEPSSGTVRKGLRTGDNFRFVRAHWELSPHDICTDGADAASASGWVPLVMTGASQPWFAPIYLAVNWKGAGRELRAFVLKYGAESRLIQAKDYYFKAGFSWTLRAARIYPYFVPAGCIFTGSRPMGFPDRITNASAILGIFASRYASAFSRLSGEKFAYPKFSEGKIKSLPVPALPGDLERDLAAEVENKYCFAKSTYSKYEPFSEFCYPSIDLTSMTADNIVFDRKNLISAGLEERIGSALGFSSLDLREFSRDLDEALSLSSGRGEDGDEDSEEDDAIVLIDTPGERALRLLSYALGCAFGRWDIRMAKNQQMDTRPRSIHVRVQAIPGGMLQEGKPTSAAKSLVGYPITVAVGGILPFDQGVECNIDSEVDRALIYLGVAPDEAFKIAFPGGGSRASNWRDFSVWHIKTYTLGRRKAPIYWQLATPSASYSVCLYIHAFGKDTLFRVQNDYVAPKLAHERRELEDLLAEAGPLPSTAQSRAIEGQTAFVEELSGLLDEVKRVAPLWDPDLDDGVILNFAPLWRLVPQNRAWQKELRAAWASLVDGDYDWARLAMRLWPQRVVPKCANDRSLAIAHDLEDVFWFEDAAGKWQPRSTPSRPINDLIAERASPAVEAALQSLIEAPDLAAASGRRRRRTRS
jgi:hypothetical protein